MAVNRGLLPWLFQRISAIVLVVGLVVHFAVLHFMIERPVTMEKVSLRLSSPGWILFDSILLIVCIYHALGGVYSVVLDFKPARKFEQALCWLFWGAGGVVAVIGIVNLIPFRNL